MTILPMVLKWEGTKFTDDPRDNGGATKFGITQNTLSTFLGRSASKDEVKNLTLEKAGEIYRKKYWNTIQGDKLPEGVALMMFDGSVNHGTKIMVEFLQRILKINVDGDFGNKTLEAVNNFENYFNLVLSLSNLRRDRYKNHEDFDRFGKGWINRLNDITNKSLSFENKYVVKKPEVIIDEEKFEEPKIIEVAVDKELETKIPEVDNKLSDATLQKLLKERGLYAGDIDGLFGKQSKTSLAIFLSSKLGNNFVSWNTDRRKIAAGQIFAKELGIDVGVIDGLYGPQTKQAFSELNYFLLTGKEFPKWRDNIVSSPIVNTTKEKIIWPYQKDVEKFYGNVGENQTTLKLPYNMVIAWDTDKIVTKMTCHEKVHDSLLRIFQNTLNHYGEEQIIKMKLNYFGGCLNVRKMRGGSAWSMHSWGIAVDLDPERNQLSWGRDKATFAKPEYEQFWKFVEEEGWISLGRTKNYDWMHFEATKG